MHPDATEETGSRRGNGLITTSLEMAGLLAFTWRDVTAGFAQADGAEGLLAWRLA